MVLFRSVEAGSLLFSLLSALIPNVGVWAPLVRHWRAIINRYYSSSTPCFRDEFLSDHTFTKQVLSSLLHFHVHCRLRLTLTAFTAVFLSSVHALISTTYFMSNQINLNPSNLTHGWEFTGLLVRWGSQRQVETAISGLLDSWVPHLSPP